MATSIGVNERTRDQLEQVKRRLGARSFDETLTKILAGQGNLGPSSQRPLIALLRKRKEIADLAKRHGIASLAIFGSVLHGDARPDSDLDLLARFKPGREVGFIGFETIRMELSDLLGCNVDLQTADSLSKYFRHEVVKEAVEIDVEA